MEKTAKCSAPHYLYKYHVISIPLPSYIALSHKVQPSRKLLWAIEFGGLKHLTMIAWVLKIDFSLIWCNCASNKASCRYNICKLFLKALYEVCPFVFVMRLPTPSIFNYKCAAV